MRPIEKHQTMASLSNKRLRRARRLYMRLCYKAVMGCPDDSVMIAMSNNMHKRGLYAAYSVNAPINWRDYRYRILRYMYRLDGSPGSHWFFWLKEKGFHSGSFSKMPKLQQAV